MKSSSPYPLPQSIREKLAELRGLISRLIACQGAVVLGIWLLSSFWLFGLLDYLPARFGADESPRLVRVCMLAVVTAGVVAILYHYFWNRWLVRWTDSSLALAIEKQHPEFQSALVTTVQAATLASPSPSSSLSHASWTPVSSPRDGIETASHAAHEHPIRAGVLALAREDAERRMAVIDVRSLVRFQTLQQELIAFAVVGALSCVLAILAPQWAWHWGSRLFALSDAPWPRTTQLGLAGIELDVPAFSGQSVRERYLVPFREGTVQVPKGSSCQLKSWAERLMAPPYDTCMLHYRDAEGNRGRANMRRGTLEKERQNFLLDGPPLESLSATLWLTLVGGDARLPNIVLEAVDAPLALATEIEITYPEYLQRSTQTAWGQERLPYRNGIRIPQGSQITFQVQANKEIQRCEIMRQGVGESDTPAERIVVMELDSPVANLAIPLGTLDSNLLVEIRLWDTHGLCSTRVQQFVIASIVDNPPAVDFTLQGIGTAITEQALLPVRSTITDDYDVNQAWIDSIVDEQPTVRVDLGLTPQGEASRDIDLKALRDAGQNTPKVGSVLALMVSSTDYFHRDDAPHIGRSTPIQLSVVTPDQLLVILERRELAMRARLEQILNELGQLRDLLVMMNRPVESKDDSESDATSEGTAEAPMARQNRILVLRAQQASAQVDKSDGELRGVGAEISQIVAELINNRVDSKDRRERLQEKIQRPLQELLTRQWEPFAKSVAELELYVTRANESDRKGRVEQLTEQNNEVISALTAILDAMVDIQDFNEVIDMVRDMLEDQNKVLERTKDEQKKRLLEALK